MGRRPPAIFLGLAEVAGYFGSLAEGFQANGCRVGFLNACANAFAYPEPRVDGPALFRLMGRIARRYFAMKAGPGRAAYRLLAFLPVKFLCLAWALARYDVFVFSANGTFFGLHDLPVYRWLRKRTVFVSLGSDSRPAYLSGIVKDDLPAGGERDRWILDRDALTTGRLATIDAQASILVDYPAQAIFRRRTCCSGLALGFPAAPRAVPPADASRPAAGRARILHAPSRPRAKGSDRIRAIVARLRAQGLDVELVELVGRPNREVLEEIARSDLVVDECFSDLPLGGLGVEAALQAKPVVVGGYFAPLLPRYLAPEDVPPSFYVLPDEMEGAIRRLVESPELRRDVGERLRTFVTTRWTPEAVAGRYLRVLAGDAPAGWFFEPGDLVHFHGWGLSDAEVRENVQALVAEHTARALHLDHDPALRERLLRSLGVDTAAKGAG